MLQNAGEGLKLLQALQRIHSGALMEVHGVKLIKNFRFFTSEGQINSFRWKKPSKKMYFEQNFNIKMV